MPKSIVQHQDGDLRMRQRIIDGYINLNDIAKSTGKRVDVWLRISRTKELLVEFEKQQLNTTSMCSLNQAILTTRGREGSTWAHPDIAIQFAQWCSPAFALWCSRIIREYMVNGAGNPLWHVQRQKIKDSNEIMRDAIAAYVQRHESELSENRKKFVYNNVNDKIAIALVGCRPAKFKRDRNANTFRDALSKDELNNLEQLEMLVTKLIEQTDLCPLEAVPEAANRLLLKTAS